MRKIRNGSTANLQGTRKGCQGGTAEETGYGNAGEEGSAKDGVQSHKRSVQHCALVYILLWSLRQYREGIKKTPEVNMLILCPQSAHPLPTPYFSWPVTIHPAGSSPGVTSLWISFTYAHAGTGSCFFFYHKRP